LGKTEEGRPCIIQTKPPIFKIEKGGAPKLKRDNPKEEEKSCKCPAENNLVGKDNRGWGAKRRTSCLRCPGQHKKQKGEVISNVPYYPRVNARKETGSRPAK